jgi:AcrR family transcriptional regulator
MTTTAKASRYRRQPDPDLSRMEIMRGAAECFEARGFAATSLDEVAARITSTKGRIYHHYGSKAELFFDVFRTGMAMNFAAIEPLLAAEMRAIDRLSAMLRAHTLSVIATKPFQSVVWEGMDMLRQAALPARELATLAELSRLRDDYSEHFLTVMEQAHAAGDATFRTPRIALNSLFMLTNGPIVWFTPRPGQSRAEIEAVADECVAYALGMLRQNGLRPISKPT